MTVIFRWRIVQNGNSSLLNKSELAWHHKQSKKSENLQPGTGYVSCRLVSYDSNEKVKDADLLLTCSMDYLQRMVLGHALPETTRGSAMAASPKSNAHSIFTNSMMSMGRSHSQHIRGAEFSGELTFADQVFVLQHDWDSNVRKDAVHLLTHSINNANFARHDPEDEQLLAIVHNQLTHVEARKLAKVLLKKMTTFVRSVNNTSGKWFAWLDWFGLPFLLTPQERVKYKELKEIDKEEHNAWWLTGGNEVPDAHRCTAITMAGIRCKRYILPSTQFCRQHTTESTKFPAIKNTPPLPAARTIQPRVPLNVSIPQIITEEEPLHVADVSFLQRYSNYRSLGQGAHGVVMKAFNKISDREVAIKFLYLNETTRLADCAREVALWNKLSACDKGADDCALVPIYEAVYVLDRNMVLIEMELITGGDGIDLAQKMEAEKVDPALFRRNMEHTASSLIPVVKTLSRMHQLGVLHRDIKPENLMMDGTTRHLLIGDLGLGCHAEQCYSSSKVVGTEAFIDPTVIRGRKQNHVSDVYSLGVTMYELLTLQKPNQHQQWSFSTYDEYLRGEAATNIRACAKQISASSHAYILLYASLMMMNPIHAEERPSLGSVIQALDKRHVKYLTKR